MLDVNVNINASALIPQLEHALLNIAGEVTKIVGDVTPLVTEDIPKLLDSELKTVPQLLNGVLSIATGVKAAADQITKTVPAGMFYTFHLSRVLILINL